MMSERAIMLAAIAECGAAMQSTGRALQALAALARKSPATAPAMKPPEKEDEPIATMGSKRTRSPA